MNDSAQTAYVATIPTLAILVVIVAHLGQAFVGGWVAARLAGSHVMAMALIIGVLSLAGGVVNFVSIGPTIEFPLYLVAAWAAGRIEVLRRA